jgi:hypothetical protein
MGTKWECEKSKAIREELELYFLIIFLDSTNYNLKKAKKI